MEFIGQVVFGVVMAVLATAVFALPGFAVAGTVGLLLRRFVHPTRRIVGCLVAAWLALCVAGVCAAIIQSETAARHGSLDALGELIVLWLGVASALGGSYALSRTLRPAGRAS